MTTAFDLCALAWEDQQGYVSIAVRNPQLTQEDEGYWVDHSFKWPEQKNRVTNAIITARTENKDVYWAPAVFTKPQRRATAVGKVHTLWADLDEADPANLPSYLKPTAVWESSPGRYQAIWKLDHPLTAEAQQELNKRLTYMIGADKGGWDLTQVLRTPGTPNHKYPDKPLVKLLHLNGHTVNPLKLVDDLPEVNGHVKTDETPLPSKRNVLAQHRQHFNARIKELLAARHARVGDRSDRLWELECLLAERGLNAEEIASLTRESVWNKFKGRRDEVHRLLTEATKSVAHAGVTTTPDTDDAFTDVEDAGPLTWTQFDSEHRPITWMVADVWGESEVGFISGLPKSYKSWVSLDLAVSVATGSRFLGIFQSRKHNVLLIQEEDPRPVLQDRLVKVGAAKGLVACDIHKDSVDLTYDLPDNLFIISNQGFTLDDSWLEMLEQWITEQNIKLVILDPLMMIAGGGFDEFKAFEFMDKVLKPLKRLRARTQASIVLVHHHIKGSTDSGAKSMYGSVALWAWEEAALHLQLTGTGRVVAERFSKHSLLGPLTIEIGDVSEEWAPTLQQGTSLPLLEVLKTFEAGATIEELAGHMNIGRDSVSRQLHELLEKKTVRKQGRVRVSEGGRPKDLWRMA